MLLPILAHLWWKRFWAALEISLPMPYSNATAKGKWAPTPCRPCQRVPGKAGRRHPAKGPPYTNHSLTHNSGQWQSAPTKLILSTELVSAASLMQAAIARVMSSSEGVILVTRWGPAPLPFEDACIST